MQVLTKEEFKLNKSIYFKHMHDGLLFIYPTDTIYGMGCDATNEAAVRKLRALKGQQTRPFSIIAPDLAWIRQNCSIPPEGEQWLRKLPGPYTLIFHLKNPRCIAPGVNLRNGTIGVRLIGHGAQRIVEEYGNPIVTTSANKAGKLYMTSTEDLDKGIAQGIDFVVYEGDKPGRPSHIVDLSKETVSVRAR